MKYQIAAAITTMSMITQHQSSKPPLASDTQGAAGAAGAGGPGEVCASQVDIVSSSATKSDQPVRRKGSPLCVNCSKQGFERPRPAQFGKGMSAGAAHPMEVRALYTSTRYALRSSQRQAVSQFELCAPTSKPS